MPYRVYSSDDDCYVDYPDMTEEEASMNFPYDHDSSCRTPESIHQEFLKKLESKKAWAPKPFKDKQPGFVHILMIKTHKKTDMKYLCKTSFEVGKKDLSHCYSYLGSGKRWLNHLNTHGNDITTEIIHHSYDRDEFAKTAFEISVFLEVVDRDDFANLTEEKGDGGLIGEGQKGKTWKIKDTSRMHGPKTKTAKVIAGRKKVARRMTGSSNPMKNPATRAKVQATRALNPNIKTNKGIKLSASARKNMSKPKTRILSCICCRSEFVSKHWLNVHFKKCLPLHGKILDMTSIFATALNGDK
jgi:hypothetical protein